MVRTGGNAGFSRQSRASGEMQPTALGVPEDLGSWKVSCSVRTCSPAMNRRAVGSAGTPAGVLRADCHAGKDAGAPRFMGREHLQTLDFCTWTPSKDEGRRTRDEEEGRGTEGEGRRTRDEGRGTKDEGRRTKDEGRRTRTRDEGR